MFRFLAKVFYACLVLIETLVAIRFVFKLIGANAQNTIVSRVYELSSVFVAPFQGIVTGDWKFGRYFVDVDALVSLVIYMLIAFVTIEIINIFTHPSTPGKLSL